MLASDWEWGKLEVIEDFSEVGFKKGTEFLQYKRRQVCVYCVPFTLFNPEPSSPLLKFHFSLVTGRGKDGGKCKNGRVLINGEVEAKEVKGCCRSVLLCRNWILRLNWLKGEWECLILVWLLWHKNSFVFVCLILVLSGFWKSDHSSVLV